MRYRPYKFLIVPVIQEVDDEGNVISELTPDQPFPVFGVAGLHEYANKFEDDLEKRIEEMLRRQTNGTAPVPIQQ